MDKPAFVYTTYIATTPEKLWEAITNPDFTERYWSASRIESDWHAGSRVALRRGDTLLVDGEVLVCEPPRRLSFTWNVRHIPEAEAEGPARVLFEIEQFGPQVCLTVTHDNVLPGGRVLELVSGGWPIILSSLKSLLETGRPLTVTRIKGGPVVVQPAAR